MASIERWVLVDRDDHEEDHEYDNYSEAVAAASARKRECAVVERTYTYDDSQLVWTPDGRDHWPPRPRARVSRYK